LAPQAVTWPLVDLVRALTGPTFSEVCPGVSSAPLASASLAEIPALAAAGSTVPAEPGAMAPLVPAEAELEDGTDAAETLGPLTAAEIGATTTDVDGSSTSAVAGASPATLAATIPPSAPTLNRNNDRIFQVIWVYYLLSPGGPGDLSDVRPLNPS
jgi:hypothetical protein